MSIFGFLKEVGVIRNPFNGWENKVGGGGAGQQAEEGVKDKTRWI